VSPEDFFSDANRKIAAALFHVQRSSVADGGGAEVCVTEVAAELRARDHLKDCGGAAYVGELMDRPAVAGRLEQVAVLIHDAARLRRSLQWLWERTAELYSGAVIHAQPWLDALASGAADKAEEGSLGGIAGLGGVAPDLGAPMRTGIAPLDEVFRLFPGELTILTAAPGGGKTACGTGIGIEVAKAGIGVLMISMEMPQSQLRNRAMSRETRVAHDAIRDGRLTGEQRAKLVQAAVELDRVPFGIYDSKSVNVDTITSLAHRSARKLANRGVTLGLVVVDYFQLLDCPGGVSHRDGRVRELDVSARRLVAMAEQLQVGVLLLAQLNTEGHVGECKALEKHAHNWLDIYMGKQVEDGLSAATIKIKKRRNGRTSPGIGVWYHQPFLTFSGDQWL